MIKKPHVKETLSSLLQDCIRTGAYYWFRAEGPDENLQSALNRMQYRQMVERLNSLGIPRPTPDEIYAHAHDKWPEHKLHPAPKAT